MKPEELTRELFARHLETTFVVRVDGAGAVELRLVEAEEHPASPRSERFALLFRGPNDKPLGQGIYGFEHEQIGAFELFIVPVGQDAEGLQYEAVFNRLRPKTEEK